MTLPALSANWTKVGSGTWGYPAEPDPTGGFDGATGSAIITHIPLFTSSGGANQIAPVTITLNNNPENAADIRLGQPNWEFTIANTSGEVLNIGAVIRLFSQNGTSFSTLANAVDHHITAPMQLTGFNLAINNGGAAGQLNISGNISQDASNRSLTASGGLTLGGANSYVGATTFRAGVYTLDYSANNATKLSDTTAFTLGGGNTALVLKGGNHEEIVSSTTLNAGSHSITQDGGTSTLRMNAIISNTGSSINFGADSLASTDTSNTNGILNGRATVSGTTWATSVNAGAADTPITGLASYATDTFGFGSNTDVTMSLAPATFTTNSLRFNTSGASTLTLTGSNTLQSGGLLVTAAVGANTTTISGGTLSPSTQLVIHQHNTQGALEIDSNIAMGPGLVKTGEGTLRFSNTTNNTGSGAVYLNQGAVEINTTNSVFGTGSLRLQGGGLYNTTGSNITLSNGTIFGPDSTNGFRSVLTFGGGNEIIFSGTKNTAGSGGSPDRVVDFNVLESTTVAMTNFPLSNDQTSLTKSGPGILALRGGDTSIFNAHLQVNAGIFRLSDSGRITSGSGSAYHLNGGTLELDNSGTNNNDRMGNAVLVFGGGELKIIGNAGGTEEENTGTGLPRSGASTLTVSANGGTATYDSGQIGGGGGGDRRLLGATLLVRGTDLGSDLAGNVAKVIGGPNNFTPTNLNASNASILPWAIADSSASGSGQTFATYDPGADNATHGTVNNALRADDLGWRPLKSTEYTSDMSSLAAAGARNVRLSGAGTTTIGLNFTGSNALNSLQLDGGHTLASSGTNTVAVSSNIGAFGASGAGVLSTGGSNVVDSSITLAFGATETIFHAVSNLTIDGTITGTTNTLAKSGAGTLTLAGGNSGRTTGNTFVNQGVLKLSALNSLYDTTNTAAAKGMITIQGRPSPSTDYGVLELAAVDWSAGGNAIPGILLNGDNATLRGSGASVYQTGGRLLAVGGVFLDAPGNADSLTLLTPVSSDSGIATTIHVKGLGAVILDVGAGNATTGTSRGNANHNWTIGGSINGNSGTLIVNASGTPLGLAVNTVTVGAGGTLGGDGQIGAAVIVQNSGSLTPGTSPGSMEIFNSLDLQTGSILDIELGGTLFSLNGTEEYDRVKVTGQTTLAGVLNVSLYGTFNLGGGQLFGIVDATGGLSGVFSNYAEGDVVLSDSGFDLKITYQGLVSDNTVALTGGNDVVLYTTELIPEPASVLLLAGLGGLLTLRRKS